MRAVRREQYTNPTGKGVTATFTPELVGDDGRVSRDVEVEFSRLTAEGLGKLIVPFHDPANGIHRTRVAR